MKFYLHSQVFWESHNFSLISVKMSQRERRLEKKRDSKLMQATRRHLVRESGKQFLPLSVEKTKSKAGVKPILEQWKPTKLKQTNKKYMRNLHTGESIVRLYDILKPLFCVMSGISLAIFVANKKVVVYATDTGEILDIVVSKITCSVTFMKKENK